MTFQERHDGSDEYATPPTIWRPLSRGVDGFDVDPASGAESTPIADVRYTKEDDGLAKAWHGDVWLNPPFGQIDGTNSTQRDRWLRKARSEANRDAVRSVTVLLPVDTSTDWFHRHVVPAPVHCFLERRPAFEGRDGHTSFAVMLIVYGNPPRELVDTLESMGAVYQNGQFRSNTIQTRLEVTA